MSRREFECCSCGVGFRFLHVTTYGMVGLCQCGKLYYLDISTDRWVPSNVNDIMTRLFFKEEKKVAELNNGYYVYNVTKRTAPTMRHGLHGEAIDEAKRLARQNPGQRFEVLALTAACEMPAPGVNVEFTPDGEEITRPPF